MSTLVLSLLFVVLMVAGVVMSKKVSEHFTSEIIPLQKAVVVDVSPALANLLVTPALVAKMNSAPLQQVDTLKREQEIKPACPVCPKCPDMSQYVRLDEVPCWNCTLP